MSTQPLSILDAFQKRFSVRIYTGQQLTGQQTEIIEGIVKEVNNLDTPFHSAGVEISQTGPGLGISYNGLDIITNEAGFIVCKIPNNTTIQRSNIIDLTYIAQHALIKLEQNHIHTIWLAGTYDRKLAEERFKGYLVPSVIAFGPGEASKEENLKLREKMGLKGGRLPFDQLFYDGIKKKNISENDLNDYQPLMKDFLTALRSGPSACNFQTWRFVIAGKEVHLFDAKVDDYSNFDMGIALANLHMLAELRGGKFNLEFRKPAPQGPPSFGEYVATAIYDE